MAAAIALLAGVGYLFVSYANPEAVRGQTERRLSAVTGRDVTIAGDFTYSLSLMPTFTAQQLSIANAEWGTHSDMLTAEEVAVELAVLPLLLEGEVEIDSFIVERAEIFIERGPQGQLNWQPDPVLEEGSLPASSASSSERDRPVLAVRELEILDSSILWRREDGSNEVAALERLAWQADPADDSLVVEARGRYAERPFSAEGGLGTLAALTAADAPSPLDLEVSFGTMRLLVEGQADFPLTEGGTDLALVLTGDGETLPALLPGGGLPPLDDWQLAAEVRSAAGGLSAAEVAGRVDSAEGLVLAVNGGAIDDLLAGSGISLPVTAEAPSLAAVETLTQMELPALGAFHVEGLLSGTIGQMSLEEASGWLGESEAAPLLQVTGGRIDNVVAGRGIDLQLRAQGGGAEALAAALGQPVKYDSLTGEARLTGNFDSLALQELQAEAANGDARLQVSGSIGDVTDLAELDLRVAATAPSLAGIGPMLGTTLPESPPVELSGHVIGGREALRVEDLSAVVAETSLQGQLELALPAEDVPQLEGRLTTTRLDLDPLWPGDAEASDSEASDEPRQTLDLPFLNALDAELALRADEVVAQGRRFGDVSAQLRLQDGSLAVEGLTARVAGGRLAGEAELDAGAKQTAEVVLRLQAENIELVELISGTVPGQVKGRLDVDVNLDSTGRTLDELAANLEGDAAVFGEAGELVDVPLNRMIPDLDITHILPFFRSRDTTVRVNCLIGEFDIDNGLARMDSMLDTRRMTLLGEGTVDLAEGTLDFELRPVGKSRKLSTSSVPVDIEGPLDDPQIRPRVGQAVGGALRGFLGGLLVPLNQLTALFGEDARDACSEALRQARQRAEERGAER